jgi:acyl transferase domain-containing protein
VALSSSKAVLGHLEGAAGMASLHAMMAALASGSLHPLPRDFVPSTAIEVERTPFYFVDRARASIEGRCGAVLAASRFGLGACVILE